MPHKKLQQACNCPCMPLRILDVYTHLLHEKCMNNFMDGLLIQAMQTHSFNGNDHCSSTEDIVTTMEAPLSWRMNSSLAGGYSGARGRYAAPALSTARMAMSISGELGRARATTVPGPTSWRRSSRVSSGWLRGQPHQAHPSHRLEIGRALHEYRRRRRHLCHWQNLPAALRFRRHAAEL